MTQPTSPRKWPGPIQRWAVIAFDLDGVLVNSKGLHERTFKRALAELSPTAAAQYELLSPNGELEALSTLRKLQRIAEERWYPRVKARKDELFERCIPEIKFHPELAFDLRRVQRTAAERVVIVTNCTNAMAIKILQHAGLQEFDFVAPLGPNIPTKPDPYLYEQAAKYCKLPRAGRRNVACAFEDSDSGFAAAKAAGFFPVLTNYDSMQERLRLCAF